ncbi:MAG TPA: dienelactone hydrolase family protein [Candidatus Bathyarchaeia archaeon]|nr:dienelactone hydrolase family protein [Candidatus Bathyarchaeia archaeon]
MHPYTTDMYEGMLAETTMLPGHNGEIINAYYARPLGPGPFPGVALIHHMPGWDELYREFTRKFAHHGYLAISPNIYFRFGHGSPDDMSAKVRGSGGVPDASVVADIDASARYLKSMPLSNRKVGVFGTCSGGRQAFLVACRTKSFDAAVNCWGGNVVQPKEKLTPAQPVAPIDYTKDLSCPLLGLFGEEDKNPTPESVRQLEEELKKYGKNYEFHMYPGAGHGFFYYPSVAYRPEAAVDGWKKMFTFFEKYLETSGRGR